MGTITALSAQVKNPDRVSVFVDGEFVCGLALEVAAGLRVGQSISAADLADLEQREEIYQARERALGLLARRPRSSSEIARHLRRHRISDGVVQVVIDDLTEKRLIDDSAFAAFWVEQRETFRPRSRLALRQELSQKGIEREVVSEALDGLDEIDAGVLGLGEKIVAVPADRFRYEAGAFILPDTTEETLKAAPAFKYAE